MVAVLGLALGMAEAEVAALVATAETAETALTPATSMALRVPAEAVEVVEALQLGVMAAAVEVEPEFLVKAQMARVGRMPAHRVQEAEDHAEPVEAALSIIRLGRAGRTAAVAAERIREAVVVVERVQAAQSVLSGPVQRVNSRQLA